MPSGGDSQAGVLTVRRKPPREDLEGRHLWAKEEQVQRSWGWIFKEPGVASESGLENNEMKAEVDKSQSMKGPTEPGWSLHAMGCQGLPAGE